jgi:5-methylcytosine-specific restriction endonuclease McrA
MANRCNRCDEVKDKSLFARKNECKACKKKRMAEYRKANAEKIAAQVVKYREENKIRISARRSAQYVASQGRINEQNKRWKEENPEKVKASKEKYARSEKRAKKNAEAKEVRALMRMINPSKPKPLKPPKPEPTAEEMEAKKEMGRAKSREYYWANKDTILARLRVSTAKTCHICNAEFTPSNGEWMSKLCSDECRTKAKKANRDRHHRASGSDYRKRARNAGSYYEPVNPITIFSRDKWRCQICGVKTPKRLRGKHVDTSPELDHIIPISRGGPHAHDNLQCLCRSCNASKSDSMDGPMGQMGLFAFTHYELYQANRQEVASEQ